MKIFDQHGYGDSTAQKFLDALDSKFIDGVILSPRDIKSEMLGRLKKAFTQTQHIVLFDPQIYVSTYPIQQGWRLKNLEDYPYFCKHEEKEFSREKNIATCIEEVLNYERTLGLKNFITPNIFIESSFDSMSAGKSSNFLAISNELWTERKTPDQNLFATLAISISALNSFRDIKKFLAEFLSQSPIITGIYIVVNFDCKPGEEAFFTHTELANLLYLIYALQTNDLKVIIGYANIYIPLFASVGAYAGATGLFTSQKRFSLSTFQPSVRKGGSKRVQRYFSTKLNLCLKMTELNTLRKLDPKQTIMNGLDRTDQFYDIDSPELQNPNQESWQMWDALKSLSSQFSNDIPQNIAKYKRHIENAIALGKLCNKRLEEPLNLQALEDMDKALSTFIKYAEL